jgi:outer membrane lipoprotein
MALKSIGRFLALMSLCFLISGCATGISRQARSQVTYNGPFTAVQRNPSDHAGAVLVLGGRIIENRALDGSSELVVLQMPLRSGDIPRNIDASEGRFLVRSGQFLDPSIYENGRLLTVVGRLVGSESRKIGGLDYVYPVVEAIEIKVWREQTSDWPNVYFGVGVGAVF